MGNAQNGWFQMMFMNRWDIEETQERLAVFPVAGKAARFLHAYMEQVDDNSDGWAYWAAPVNAAKKLMTLLERAKSNQADITEAEFRSALSPIRAFYTRKGTKAGMQWPAV